MYQNLISKENFNSIRDKHNINVVNSEIKGLIIEKFDLWKWKKETWLASYDEIKRNCNR